MNDGDKNFSTAAEAVAFIKSRSDDIEKVTIHTSDVQVVRSGLPSGEVWKETGMVVRLLSGGKYVVHREVAEQILNDGLLNRLRIKIELGR